MTAIPHRERRWLIALINLLHLPLLLLPTLLLEGATSIDTATTLLACGIFAAALLESLCVTRHTFTATATIQDPLAICVALFVGIALLVILWVAQLERIWHGINSQTMLCCGLILLTAGIALRIAAIRALGLQFISDISREGEIIHSGIYTWLRHPSEIGLLLIAAGSPLIIGAPRIAAVAAIVLTPISIWRMRRENLALALQKGSPPLRRRESTRSARNCSHTNERHPKL